MWSSDFWIAGLDTIAKNLDREVAKNKITAGDKVVHAGADYGGSGSSEAGGLRSGDRGGDGEI